MDSLDMQVLTQARNWVDAGHDAWLITVIETRGSVPRPPGALLVLREDGLVIGSVSGACVEDDLIGCIRHGERVERPALVAYGVSREEAARFGLPCGGTLQLVQEPLRNTAWIDEVLALHGPIGFDIGSRTPAEIAIAILAEVVAVDNGIEVLQKKPEQSVRAGNVCAT